MVRIFIFFPSVNCALNFHLQMHIVTIHIFVVQNAIYVYIINKLWKFAYLYLKVWIRYSSIISFDLHFYLYFNSTLITSLVFSYNSTIWNSDIWVILSDRKLIIMYRMIDKMSRNIGNVVWDEIGNSIRHPCTRIHI